MKLPSITVIAPEKIREYLLSFRKRNDKSKWLAAAGYKLADWHELERDLRTQILTQNAVFTEETSYGKMYEIKSKLTGPKGKVISVRTIWMTENESGLTKFITMFPDRR